ncbi:hypothetical protein IFM89_034812 [Coptis chinensis]|uniref:Bromo domain-containing protein n=1 Tax=Coptis chinensis TaxID=261450 RepID=A0A835HAA9_9MAGN|nr:hypothetical protein IFM89_034812 [Coptis chinensis]
MILQDLIRTSLLLCPLHSLIQFNYLVFGTMLIRSVRLPYSNGEAFAKSKVIGALSAFLSHIALRPRSLNSSVALWPKRSIRRVNNPMSSVRFCSESPLLLQELQRVENENPLGNNGQPLAERPTPQMAEKRTLRVVLEIMQSSLMRVFCFLDSFSEKTREIFAVPVDPVEYDVFLIFENAMLFNAQNTIFYCQAQAIDELAKQVVRTLRTKPGNLEHKLLMKKRHGRKPKFETRSLNSTLQPELNTRGRLAAKILAQRTREGQPRSSYRPFKSFLNETESLISEEATCSKSIVRIDNGRMGGYGYKESLACGFVEGPGPTTNKVSQRNSECIIPPLTPTFQATHHKVIPSTYNRFELSGDDGQLNRRRMPTSPMLVSHAKLASRARPHEIECFLREKITSRSTVAFSSYKNIEVPKSQGMVLGTYYIHGDTEVTTCYEAESIALVERISKSMEMWLHHLRIETASVATTKAFQSNNVSWKVRAK